MCNFSKNLGNELQQLNRTSFSLIPAILPYQVLVDLGNFVIKNLGKIVDPSFTNLPERLPVTATALEI